MEVTVNFREASVKFFDETFFQKSFDLALDLTRRAAHEKKLGKQGLCPAFPERWRTEKVVSQGLGCEPAPCPLSHGCRLGRPLGNVPPGRSGPRRGSRVSSPPEACRRPSLASPFGGRWCPVGTVQRLVSAAASVGDGRSPLGCITRAGRRECPRRGRRGQPASGTSPKQSLFALTYRPAVPYNHTTSWGSSLLGLPSGNVNTLANAWYCLKKRDSWKTSI